MNILLIGVGRWGKNHYRILSGIKGINLYVSDTDPTTASYLEAQGMNMKNFSHDYHDFLPSADAVFVITPAQLHFSMCMDALKADCDLFIEKPIYTDYKHAMRIHEEAEKRDKTTQVGHIFRYHPVTKEILENHLTGDALGSLKYIKGMFKGFKRPRMDVGVTMTDTIHFVDLFSYLIGQWPARAYGKSQEILGRGMDDLSLSCLFFENGTTAFIESGYFQPRTLREIMIAGDRKSLIADYKALRITVRENIHIKRGNGWEAKIGESREVEIEAAEPLFIEISSFIDSVKTRTRPRVTALEGARAVKVIETLYESSKKGKEIDITY